eukprot:scaffold606766_cov45-Prasinocladus_malaysianus.AAC.1
MICMVCLQGGLALVLAVVVLAPVLQLLHVLQLSKLLLARFKDLHWSGAAQDECMESSADNLLRRPEN